MSESDAMASCRKKQSIQQPTQHNSQNLIYQRHPEHRLTHVLSLSLSLPHISTPTLGKSNCLNSRLCVLVVVYCLLIHTKRDFVSSNKIVYRWLGMQTRFLNLTFLFDLLILWSFDHLIIEVEHFCTELLLSLVDGCPTDFTPHPTNGLCYYHTGISVDFFSAEKHCRSFGYTGKLLILETVELANWLMTNVLQDRWFVIICLKTVLDLCICVRVWIVYKRVWGLERRFDVVFHRNK